MMATQWTDSFVSGSAIGEKWREFRPNKQPARLAVPNPDIQWWDSILNRLEYLVHLKNGWDGYRAPPVNFLNAYFAGNVLQTICNSDSPEPSIVPGSSGDLQIEWDLESLELEIHIIEPNLVAVWFKNASTGDDGEEFVVTNNFIKVSQILNQIGE